ncbi:MAG: hypothetical protein KIT80_17885 [Chitinophagaceae bacterium]|nr:hypothetical protein [Chitinophagaceae bacterium]MCW5928796.1 hypothetical protein [Chitinophagaceae bacterium]
MKNILLANHHLENPDGSETYTYTMAEELVKRNVNVEYFIFYREVYRKDRKGT